MKINPVVVFLFFVFLFVNCSSKGKDNREQESKDAASAQESRKQTRHEDFYQFLDKFNTKRIFQLERIIFPIMVSAPDANRIALAPTEEKIEKKDWELLDLSYDSTYTTRDFDKYTQTINFRKDTAHVALRGVDNGIYADYYFKLIDGEWFLVTLVE
jgi:hypothetical protein